MGYKRAERVTMSIMGASFDPLDSTVYYFSDKGSQVPTTAANYRYMSIPYTGIITGCVISSVAGTVTGSNELIDFKIRKNNTTDYDVGTVSAASVQRVVKNMALNIPITNGDSIEIKITTPAWATNPEGMYFGGIVEITI